MMKTAAVAAALTTVVSMLAAAPAQADELAADVEVVDVSYRSQILLADGAAIALMVGGSATDSEAVQRAGLVTAGLGGAAVHLAHGNPGRALASVALRGGLTYAGLGLGIASCNAPADFGCFGKVFLGGAVGYGAAAIIDIAVLGRQTRRARPLPVAPQLAMSPTGVQLGLGGTF